MTKPDLSAAERALEVADSILRRATRSIASSAPDPNEAIDANQVVAYDLAHTAAAVATGRAMLDYGSRGDGEAALTCCFVADALADLAARVFGREGVWQATSAELEAIRDFAGPYRDPRFLASVCEQGEPPRHLPEELEMVRDTYRRFAEDRIRPVADEIHRKNLDIPEEIISGLAELGTFGLSIPESYGGFAGGSEDDYLAMCVATEELSRVSLCAGGSLITRPEILARALEAGGTEDQKRHWLPKLASGEVMNAVAVTEPDYGSDVANIKVSATPTEGGWLINGVKTWCTFAARADVLSLLARTDPDRTKGHRGLSLFIVPKERAPGEGFILQQSTGGRLEGRPIDTIGYRGMHSYELAFENWFVPAENLIGGEEGLGKGFYYQMAGFENGRLQTAARAVGVMQAAYEEAVSYASERRVFGSAVIDYQLSKAKIARMAAMIAASRQFMYDVARRMASGGGQMEASMIKAYVCKAAEWVTREAMQLHGGFGYAEEYPVSRFFVDARVLSIFEGADETLCLKVIARRLITEA
ncbi:MAG: acyl-CoA dehydrogenase [Acidimicrobiales bacterium]|nr:MAG: acyl-CoA dehydrogenase [Acidimicrobiales bacterium]